MMSGQGPNPIFFNKKNKDWTWRTFANPSPPTSDNISFLHHLTPTSPQSGRHMCITPNCISWWNIRLNHKRWLTVFRLFFCKKLFKRNIIHRHHNFLFLNSQPQNVFKLFLFFYQFQSCFSFKLYSYKKEYEGILTHKE